MAIAAVPDYLGKDYSSASPGLRFGMYLPVWNAGDWSKIKSKVGDLHPVVRLNADHKALMGALRQRQLAAAAALDQMQVLSMEALAVAPFTTGLGNEHPLENGFAFFNPYGLPYLAGSGVKGVLCKAATELSEGLFGDAQGWTNDAVEALFGSANERDDSGRRGALIFWDVLPEIAGDALKIEVMTAHQSHYLQNSASPHESGQPNPINFIAVPPRSHFDFVVQCDLPFLGQIAPALLVDQRWKTLLTAAFEHAFAWLGFGAKTAVGYGAMQVDHAAISKRQAAEEERSKKAAEEERRKHLTAAEGHIEDFVAAFRAKHEQYPNYRENPNASFHAKARELAKVAHADPDWSASERRAAAEAIETWLPKLVRIDIKDERKKLKLNALKGS